VSGGPTYAQILDEELQEICDALGCDPRSPGAVREALLAIERLTRERDEARRELAALRDAAARVVAVVGPPLQFNARGAFDDLDKDEGSE